MFGLQGREMEIKLFVFFFLYIFNFLYPYEVKIGIQNNGKFFNFEALISQTLLLQFFFFKLCFSQFSPKLGGTGKPKCGSK